MDPADSPSRADSAFAVAVGAVRRGEQSFDAAVAALIDQLTEGELLWLLDGDLTILRGVREMSQRYNRVHFVLCVL